MRRCFFVLLFFLLSFPALAADQAPASRPQPVALEFSGYKFGQSPAANMVCGSGYCKSQAPGGDGRITYPFSTYETPGAVTTLAGLTIVKPRYVFWDNQLYRVSFQVDCTPQETEECLDDIVNVLDREYGLSPLSASTVDYFTTERRSIYRDFLSDAGAMVRLRANRNADGWQMPNIDIVDKGMADLVGSTLSPNFTPKKIVVPAEFEKK